MRANRDAPLEIGQLKICPSLRCSAYRDVLLLSQWGIELRHMLPLITLRSMHAAQNIRANQKRQHTHTQLSTT